ncbi:hypothetical protein S7711_01099 [Stachybotrys chartarum IBT 7711]|uniref:Carboxy-cis,cis-muconate cyclase n=1 Tax=Stachybotrys chartarum (strain CBS 109288 / IBT 7711) TaxID=1280523 RepID=A0A084B4F5_STACB|nr:hypothetical protein S7711_01099 [Stachybotrys chartarum IBT 7711]
MRFPINTAVRAAALSQARANHYDNSTTNSSLTAPNRMLVGSLSQVHVIDYLGGSTSVAINSSVSGDPSWLAFAGGDLVYAVDEWSSTLRLLRLNYDTKLTELVVEAEGSIGVVHLEFSRDRTRMVGSAYGSAAIDVWKTEDNGLEFLKTVNVSSTASPDQATPRPHQAVLDPSGRFFAVNDLGTDSIHTLDSQDDAFAIINTVTVGEGCGPRHGVFYPAGAAKATHYFVVCERTNEVLAYAVEYIAEGGLGFTLLQVVPTYTPIRPPVNATVAAAGGIVLASNNADLYVTNRLTGREADSIVHFNVNPAWSSPLTHLGEYSSHGLNPRAISLTCDEKALFVANVGTAAGAPSLVQLARAPNGTLSTEPGLSPPENLFAAGQGTGPRFVEQIA